MPQSGSGTLLCRRNARLDSFLKRNVERVVYERIRAYEPCVVVSESINKVYMHVVLSDECVYLTEYPPRTLTAAVSFRRVRDIELVNDLPDFLSGKDRERCQHIRIIYIAEKPAGKRHDWLKGDKKERLPPVAPPSRRNSHCPEITSTLQVGQTLSCKICTAAAVCRPEEKKEELPPVLKHTRSASCPNPETLDLLGLLVSPPSCAVVVLQLPRRIGSVLSRLLRRGCVDSKEEREVELHLYAVSQTSRLYFHLQSSWNSFIIRSTLLLDPLYRRRCRASSSAPAISWERTAHLFGQLSSELLQDGISVESLYLLLQELRTAAHRNVMLRRLFWRSSEVCTFLVHTLEGCLHGCQSPDGLDTADQLLLSTLIVETFAIMFRETEVEAARLGLLSAKKGALTSRMLLALICDPQPQTHSGASLMDLEVSSLLSLRALLAEYLNAASSLLFELLLVGHSSRCFSADSFLSVGWILRVLQPHPHLLSFIDYQVQQVVLVLTGLQESVLSPAHSVLLFQRLHLLLACLQYSSQLAQHLRSHFREEFRYSVKPPEATLPPHYPISRPTLRLVEQIQALILHR
uniref:Si:ch211-258f14.2 n=1 Tax=Amphilophus citrinellus TaxID=61819 RepID=A0A3Q0RXN3_AMPCI